jgi:hypothetical protein
MRPLKTPWQRARNVQDADWHLFLPYLRLGLRPIERLSEGDGGPQ